MTLAEMDQAATLEGVRPARSTAQLTDTVTTGHQSLHRRVRVPNGAEPPWWPAAVERFRELLALEHGWDTYSAPRIDRGVVDQAILFAWKFGPGISTAPWIVPTSLGGLQLEWHEDDRAVEVAFNPGQPVNLYVEDEDGEEEGPYGAYSDLLARVLNRL
jgi:hypothetical protein